MEDLTYTYENSGYTYDDFGRECEFTEFVKKTAVHALHATDEDMWFFEETGRNAAEWYAEKIRKNGKNAEVFEVPYGVMLRVRNKA